VQRGWATGEVSDAHTGNGRLAAQQGERRVCDQVHIEEVNMSGRHVAS
jgi:hypothetical protein